MPTDKPDTSNNTSGDNTNTSSNAALKRLVAEIKRRRDAAGLSHQRLANEIYCTRPLISRAESGKCIPSHTLVQALDSFFDANGALIRLRAQAKAEQQQLRQVNTTTAAPAGGQVNGSAPIKTTISDCYWPANVEDARRATMSLLSSTWDFRPQEPIGVEAVQTATLRWLIGPPDSTTGRSGGQRRASVGDAMRIRAVRRHLKVLDDAYGGGTAFPMALCYLRGEVTPLLEGSYDNQTGRELLEATAELVLDAGWMAYDQGLDQHQARQYLLRALRLAHAAGNRLLGGRVLCALSHQALHLGQESLALDFVRAARTGTASIAPAKVTAMLAAMEACVHAARNDASACAASLVDAENALSSDRASDDGLEWLDFDEGGLWGHAARAYRDLAIAASGAGKTSKAKAAERYAARSVSLCRPEHGRTRAQRNAILAGAYLQLGEIEQAASIGSRILTDASNVHSCHIYADVAALVTAMGTSADSARGFLDPARELLARDTMRSELARREG